MKLFDLQGKIAIVTGADTGLGQGMALGLAEAGAFIVCVSIADLSDTSRQLDGMGARHICIQTDLSKMENLQPVVDQAVDAFGGIDILVNNAGIIRRCDAIDFTEKDWDDVMDLNLKALFFLSQDVARQMVKQGRGGKIISVASMLSYQGGIRVPSYTSSKSGVMGLTRLLANEWAKYGINVNAIAPGYMSTNNTAALRADEQRYKEILGRIPAGRWGLPEDLKGVAVFLASNASDYVQGFTIAVDGGWLAR